MGGISQITNLVNLDAAVSSRLATADARLNNLDAAISSRLATADTRLGSKYTNNPKELPICAANVASVIIKSSNTTSAALNVAGVSATIAQKGARAAIIAADTYVTVANLLGAGILTGVITPFNTGAGSTVSIRLTVDGAAAVVFSQAIDDSELMILGALVPGFPEIDATYSGHGGGVGLFYDGGFSGVSSGNLHEEANGVSYKILPTPHNVTSLGLPALRFNTSLLVEVKCSVLPATIDPNRYGMAIYRLDMA